ncbi:cytochrome b [Phenylobacterium sp. 20VBR1]|uniref:Cytochrome b n=1 Tax=Phenylobacterium glaciei TaxID=2803784 RepID=A0A941D1L1_9CAUL|nr:cytochrome b [Phenylobacterium glaciei]MBR7619912.1 cytochrome b [Phenylobacterium glaciei]QQZ48848.1 cytochrome b [Phenylobacterium glaciei]
MSLRNTRAAYGWAAIALHWISAVGVTALYFLGDQMEDAPDRAAKIAAQNLHVSVAVLLFSFLGARLLWSLSQPHPRALESNVWLHRAAMAVQGLFLLMIAVLLVTGPLAVWSAARPIQVFDLFAIPSPFPVRIGWLREAAEEVHGAATKLFWPLIALHVAGALKHLVIDRDGTLQRMLWVKHPRQA